MQVQQLIQLQMKFQIHQDLHICRWCNTYKCNSSLSGSTAVCDFADVSYTSASFTANGALIYNDTQSDKAVAVIAFGGDKTVSCWNFHNSISNSRRINAIIRIA